MSPILRAPDGASSADMIADGWERQVAQRRRKRLEWEHHLHKTFTEDCSHCERAVMAWLIANEPRKSAEELFR